MQQLLDRIDERKWRFGVQRLRFVADPYCTKLLDPHGPVHLSASDVNTWPIYQSNLQSNLAVPHLAVTFKFI